MKSASTLNTLNICISHLYIYFLVVQLLCIWLQFVTVARCFTDFPFELIPHDASNMHCRLVVAIPADFSFQFSFESFSMRYMPQYLCVFHHQFSSYLLHACVSSSVQFIRHSWLVRRYLCACFCVICPCEYPSLFHFIHSHFLSHITHIRSILIIPQA